MFIIFGNISQNSLWLCSAAEGKQRGLPIGKILIQTNQYFEEPVPYALLTLLLTFQYYTLTPSLQDSLQPRSYASKVKEKLKQMLNECFQVQGGHGRYLFYLPKVAPELYLPQGVEHWLCDSLDAVRSRVVTNKKVALDHPKI